MKQFMYNLIAALTMIVLMPAYNALGQQSKIKGSIVNSTGNPIENATVTGTSNPQLEAKSDKNGGFILQAQPGQQLEVKAAEYSVQSVTVQADKNNYYIILRDTTHGIHIGNGMMRNEDNITSAVSNVEAYNLDNTMALNVGNALIGKLPGLMVLENGGQPPSGGPPPSSPGFYVRGRSTFQNSSPLILVDGFQQDLYALSMSEVQSVSVLKDAAALAKYGQRGANGVILVNTKRGDFNSSGLHVTAKVGLGINKPTRLPEFVGSSAYASASNETRINDGRSVRYDIHDLEGFDTYADGSSALYPNVDWFDRVLRDHAVTSKYDVSLQGGGDKARYFAMLNYNGNNGLYGPVSTTDQYSSQLKYSRFKLRTNLDVLLTDNITFHVDFSGNTTERNVAGRGTPNIFNALYTVPSAAFPYKNPDGSFGGDPAFGPSGARNPLADLTSTGYNNHNTRRFTVTGSLTDDLSTLLEGLSAGFTARLSNFGEFGEGKLKRYIFNTLTVQRNQAGEITDTTYTQHGQDNGLSYYSHFNNLRRYFDIQGKLHYHHDLGPDNTLKATGLFHQSSNDFDGRDQTFRRQNFFGNVHLGFSHKYFFDVSGSYSGNNRLQKGNRFRFFPAVSAAWIISREDFWGDGNFMNRLKLQASWGITGNDRVPVDNPYEQYYNGDARGYWFKDSYQSRGGFAEGHLAAYEFTDETSHKSNLGIQAGFIHRLFLNLDLFYDHRTHILTANDGTTSYILGIQPARESNGVVNNRGIDGSLTWKDHIGKVSYHIGGQLTYAKNEIADEQEQYRPDNYLKRTGESVGQTFGLQAVGFFKSQQDIANSADQRFSSVAPGDVKYKDQNGDEVINEQDEIPIGYSDTNPEIYYSASLGFGVGGFKLSALFQGVAHYTAHLNTASVFRPMINNNTISTYYFNRRWTPQTASTATLPRLSKSSSDNNYRANSIWLADRSYFKLRTLRFSYSLPESVVSSISFNDIEIYALGNNLFSLDDIPVLDPEQLSAGYPLFRSYSAGLKFKF